MPQDNNFPPYDPELRKQMLEALTGRDDGPKSVPNQPNTDLWPTFDAETLPDGTFKVTKTGDVNLGEKVVADNDKVPIGFGLVIDHGRVIIQFNQPVTTIALNAEQARQLGNGLLDRARQAD